VYQEPWQWLILGTAAMIIGASKTGIPGLGILAVTLVALVMPARQSTGMILPMLIAGDICAVAYYRLHASWKYILRLAPWAVTGILIGTWALGRLNDAQIRPLIGGIVLALVIGNIWLTYRPGLRERLQESHALAAGVGILAGFTTMVANAAGPIMIIYLLAMGLPKNVFLGTAAWYFLLLNLFKVPFSAGLGLITWPSLTLNAMLLPAILLGAGLGARFARRLPEKTFALVAQVLAAVAAVKLLAP
jgi:uncharacterized membrane protein YfcA